MSINAYSDLDAQPCILQETTNHRRIHCQTFAPLYRVKAFVMDSRGYICCIIGIVHQESTEWRFLRFYQIWTNCPPCTILIAIWDYPILIEVILMIQNEHSYPSGTSKKGPTVQWKGLCSLHRKILYRLYCQNKDKI